MKDEIKPRTITFANPSTYNVKDRNVNEGLHVALIAESYLFNEGQTKLEYFDVIEEQERVVSFLQNLCCNDDATYTPRPIIPASIDKYLFMHPTIPSSSKLNQVSCFILYNFLIIYLECH